MREKIINFLKNLQHNKRFVVLPLLAVTWNELVYYGGRIFAKDQFHYDLSFSVDEKIPLLPWTVSIYFICFLFWAMIYCYMATREKKVAYRFFLADFIGKSICCVFFLLFPTMVERPEITGNGLWENLMIYLYQVDSADNLFPSIHCMVSWFCWIGVREQKDCAIFYRYGTILFAVAICISTLTTKQHVLIDVAGGILFAELSYSIAKKCISYIYHEKHQR